MQYRSAAIAQQNGISLSAFVLNFQRCHQSDRLSFSNYCFFFKVEPGKGRNEPLTPMQSVCVCVCVGMQRLKKFLCLCELLRLLLLRVVVLLLRCAVHCGSLLID